MSEPAFDPIDTFVHIADGPAATPLENEEDLFERLAARTDLGPGRLVAAFRFSEDWPVQEIHPAGDEIVILVSGAMDLVLEDSDGERVVPLRGRGACIVPQGVWHTARVHEPSEALFITRGAGTEHRPVEARR